MGNFCYLRKMFILVCAGLVVVTFNFSCALINGDLGKGLQVALGAVIEQGVTIPWFMAIQSSCAAKELWLDDESWVPGGSPMPARQCTYVDSVPDGRFDESPWRLIAIEILEPVRLNTRFTSSIAILETDQGFAEFLDEFTPRSYATLLTSNERDDAREAKLGQEEHRYDAYWERSDASPVRRYKTRVKGTWPTIEVEDLTPIPILKHVTIEVSEPQLVSDAEWQELLRRAENGAD